VTAAHACAARVGLPVTLREHVRQFSVVTGASTDGMPELDWEALAAPGAAFAIYMGVGNVPILRRNLLSAGADPQTPVVVVENGTRDNERAVATTLQDLANCTSELALSAPAVIFVGLDWADAGIERPEGVTVYRRRPSPERRTEQAPPVGMEVMQ
jgi:uroporphyrin-III C-methyltransferase/precorrin-2 dehydrogenase/sirohydrochlorin ferrochelatase